MNSNEKSKALIIKLNRMTADGTLSWAIEDPPRTINNTTDDHIDLFLVTKIKGQRFALVHSKAQFFNPDFDTFYWGERLYLALLDSEDRIVWEERELVSALTDLYNNARRQASKIDSIIDDLLTE